MQSGEREFTVLSKPPVPQNVTVWKQSLKEMIKLKGGY
jgi:hypothetical protein